MVLPVYVWARWKSGLACVAYGACFTDNRNLYLTRIGHLILYLLGDFGLECLGGFVVNLVGTDDNAEFTAGLDGVGLCYAGV